MYSFDLTEEKWIPCVIPDGSFRYCSLREVLMGAHSVRELMDPSPLVTVALHRVLLAIAHRLFGPRDLGEWIDLWQLGAFDGAAVQRYLDQWRFRFDLFDRERPFYQVQEMDDARRHPVQLLATELSSGNNATLFDHSNSSRPVPVDPGQAARWLVARQSFSVALGKSSPFYLVDSPLARGYSVLVLGDNLFETIMLNMHAYTEREPIPGSSCDAPIWEQDDPATPDPEGTPARGYLDYLTWQSRRVHLFACGQGVLECQVQQNLKLLPVPPDPFKCYRRDEKRGYVPMGFQPDRSLWRDSEALLRDTGQASQRPVVFDWLAQVEQARRSGRVAGRPRYRFGVYGFATDPGKAAKVLLWRAERLPLPTTFLLDQELVIELGKCIQLAGEVARLLSRLARYLARLMIAGSTEGARNPQPAEIAALAATLGLERQYWPALTLPFLRLLDRLPDDLDRAQIEWEQALDTAATAAFLGVTSSLEQSAGHLRAAALAERLFFGGLRKVLASEREVLETATG